MKCPKCGEEMDLCGATIKVRASVNQDENAPGMG